MSDPCFFGFGSLVNLATHSYPDARVAWLSGWRREWRATTMRSQAFLTISPDSGSEIAGIVANVPGGDWAALDERETGYARQPVSLRTQSLSVEAQVYAVEPKYFDDASEDQAILLSYLDVVLQGYLREFGLQGVYDFVATTDGWDMPVLDDRAVPRYARAQALSASERALVDDQLATGLGSRIVSL